VLKLAHGNRRVVFYFSHVICWPAIWIGTMHSSTLRRVNMNMRWAPLIER